MRITVKEIIFGLFLLIGIVLWVISFSEDPKHTWISLVIGTTFLIPLSTGILTWSAIIIASHGEWPGRSELFSLSAIGFALPTLLIILACWGASIFWQPWTVPEYSVHTSWFTPWFVFTRELILFVIFWGIAWKYVRNRMMPRARTWAAWVIISFGIVNTIFAFDFIMGVQSVWSSSLFGAYIFMSGLYAAIALWAFRESFATLLPISTPKLPYQIRRLHDLGKLLYAFCMLTGYLMFCQLLPIWYENLPHERSLLIPRINFLPWSAVSIVLLIIVYLGPLLFLLPRKSKRSPLILLIASSLIISGLVLERFWLLLPIFQINSLALSDLGIVLFLIGTGFFSLRFGRYIIGSIQLVDAVIGDDDD